MKQNKVLLNLLEILDSIIQDKKITQREVDSIQNWIDDNAVLFTSKEGDGKCDSEKIILPLQKFIEDGEYTMEEVSKTRDLIQKYLFQ